MKTIISFIDWYVPGYKAGGTLKAFSNQVAHLDNFYFKIITRNTDYCDTQAYTTVESNKWIKVSENSEVFYASNDYINLSNIRNLISTTSFDYAYIHGIYSFWFSILPVILLRKYKEKRVVVSAHGMFGKHSISVKKAKKKVFGFAVRMTNFYKNVIFHAANISEANDIKEVTGKYSKVLIAEELPMKLNTNTLSKRIKETGNLKLISIARISPEKNTKFAIEVLRNCTNGNIIYDIFGPIYDNNYWIECQNEMKYLPANVSVNYKGSLPGNQVIEKLKEYHFMYLPTTGENFGHTILESFIASTPVIISDKTPWQKLEENKTGWSLPLENTKLFIEIINAALDLNQNEYNSFSENAYQFAETFVNDKTIIEQNIKLFENE